MSSRSQVYGRTSLVSSEASRGSSRTFNDIDGGINGEAYVVESGVWKQPSNRVTLIHDICN